MVLGKKKDNGAVTIQSSKTAVVIGHTKEGGSQGNTNKGVGVIAEYLDTKGITNYLVEVGGEVRSKGYNENNDSWRIGIDKPELEATTQSFQEIISISNILIKA